MEKEYSVVMSLFDYIPVIMFIIASGIIIRDLKNKMSKASIFIFALGVFLVGSAGILKATYKLLYSLSIGDFEWMSRQFFSNQAIGFLLAGIGMMMFVLKPDKNTAYSIFPTMALASMMVIGTGAMDAGLCYIANKMKKRNAMICFIVSFFMYIAMGYLSSKDFAQSYMNWAAEIVNLCGQILFLSGVKILDKAGLKDY